MRISRTSRFNWHKNVKLNLKQVTRADERLIGEHEDEAQIQVRRDHRLSERKMRLSERIKLKPTHKDECCPSLEVKYTLRRTKVHIPILTARA